MRVILLENIKGVGFIGDVKDVSDGYGRNFLLPRNMAKPATPSAMKDVERLQAKKADRLKIEEDNARQASEKLTGMTFTIIAKANEHGTLFDGLTAKDVLVKIQEAIGMQLDIDALRLEEPIKSTGDYPLTLQLTKEIAAQITLTVTAE